MSEDLVALTVWSSTGAAQLVRALSIPIFALATDAYVWELLITRLLWATRLNMYLQSDVCLTENLPIAFTVFDDVIGLYMD